MEVKGKELGNVFCKSTIKVRYKRTFLVLPTYVIESMLDRFTFDVEKKIINEHLVHPTLDDSVEDLPQAPSYYPIDSEDNHMTLEEFRSQALNGCLIDYDGFGEYATDDAKTRLRVYPSDVLDNNLDTSWSHVVWYNR